MSENRPRRHADRRKDVLAVLLAVALSVLLAGVVGGGALLWRELEQVKADRVALAEQVRQLGGKPVVEPKPGDRGDRGLKGDKGDKGDRGLPGSPGRAGPTPPCMLVSTKCQGRPGIPGKTGADGTDGVDGQDGADGTDGVDGVDGKDGVDGTDGKDGRGIASGPSCVDDDTGAGSHWVTTYTDGTTSTSDGPCRIRPADPPPAQ